MEQKSDSIQLWQENNPPRQRKKQNIPDTTNPPSTDKASRYWILPARNLAWCSEKLSWINAPKMDPNAGLYQWQGSIITET